MERTCGEREEEKGEEDRDGRKEEEKEKIKVDKEKGQERIMIRNVKNIIPLLF